MPVYNDQSLSIDHSVSSGVYDVLVINLIESSVKSFVKVIVQGQRVSSRSPVVLQNLRTVSVKKV